MSESTQKQLQQAFVQISQSRTREDLASSDADFREAFLAYGSETPDNVKAAGLVSVQEFAHELNFGFGGLTLSRLGISLASILNEAEGCEIPRQVSLAYPEMKQEEWDATLRFATMALIAFESAKEHDETN